MSSEPRRFLSSSALRADFDAIFTRPLAAESAAQLDLLVIRCGEHGYALRLSQLAALHADRKLTEAPGPRPELMGLVGVRGVVAPVYDLHALLGYARLASPRWLALVQAPAPLALSFEHFERHLRVPLSDVVATQGEANRGLIYAQSSVKIAGGLMPLLDLLTIFKDLTHKSGAASAPPKGEKRP